MTLIQIQNKRKRQHSSREEGESSSEVESTDISLHDDVEEEEQVEHIVRPARLSQGGSSYLIVRAQIYTLEHRRENV